ncbi:MAG: adenine deaminase [Spirochaetales bacterium]|nr:adenine deaminase [Spirochaetales bacterium]
MFKISGQIVDVVKKNIFPGTISIDNGIITSIIKNPEASANLILPGLIDSHIHIESSMLTPARFAKAASVHGTTACVCDPHEIAAVCGVNGINFMIENGRQTPFKFFFGAPSCIPSTSFESTGAKLGPEIVSELLNRDDIHFLSEVMNYPGVINNEEGIIKKIAAAKKIEKPIDGHAPGVSGKELLSYVSAGISTDHEAYTLAEAREKLKLGMKIQIREGSAAHNFDTLLPLIKEYPDDIMFCSDDKHPNDLLNGHINLLIKKAISKGYEPLSVIKCATLNIKNHYNLSTGMLQEGDPADIIIVESFERFDIKTVYIDGKKVTEDGSSLIENITASPINNFHTSPKKIEDFKIKASGNKIKIIEVIDGQLITNEQIVPVSVENGMAISSPERDILKICVTNRYHDKSPAVCFIKNFGLKHGAIASSVAHDSHNIIAVGCTDKAIAKAVNLIIEAEGGLSAVDEKGNTELLKLPIAGIMTDSDIEMVAKSYLKLDTLAKNMGCKLSAPYMTLAFMALPVIPELKITDKGLFNSKDFSFTSLFLKDS